MDKNLIVNLCGWHSIVFAIFHLAFWKLFDWPSALRSTRVENSAITQILNLRLIYIFLLTAFLCFIFTEELSSTGLGRAFLAGMAIFWLGRTLEQFIFLRMNHWLVHVLTVMFVIGFVLFLIPVIL